MPFHLDLSLFYARHGCHTEPTCCEKLLIGFVLVTLILNLQNDLSLHFVVLIAFTNICLKCETWTKGEESYDLSKYAVDLVKVFNGTFVRAQTTSRQQDNR